MRYRKALIIALPGGKMNRPTQALLLLFLLISISYCSPQRDHSSQSGWPQGSPGQADPASNDKGSTSKEDTNTKGDPSAYENRSSAFLKQLASDRAHVDVERVDSLAWADALTQCVLSEARSTGEKLFCLATLADKNIRISYLPVEKRKLIALDLVSSLKLEAAPAYRSQINNVMIRLGLVALLNPEEASPLKSSIRAGDKNTNEKSTLFYATDSLQLKMNGKVEGL